MRPHLNHRGVRRALKVQFVPIPDSILSFQLPSHSRRLHHVPISSALQFTVDLASSKAEQWWRKADK